MDLKSIETTLTVAEMKEVDRSQTDLHLMLKGAFIRYLTLLL